MISLRRHLKKTAYALLFLTIIILPIGIYLYPKIVSLTTPETAPSLPPPVSVAIESVETITHADNLDIVARIRNPNPRAGIPNYSASFVLLDDEEQELLRINEPAYLLPGSLNYIASLNVPLLPSLSRVKVETPQNPEFSTLPEAISLPSFNSFLKSRTTANLGNTTVEKQTAIITNRGSLGYRHVDVVGVALDQDGKVIGVSKTNIGEFTVGEQREITLVWPKPARPTHRVIISLSTNIYNPDNFMPIKGDPTRLR